MLGGHIWDVKYGTPNMSLTTREGDTNGTIRRVSQFSDGLRSELERLGLSQVRASGKAWPGDLAGPKRIARWVNGKNDPGVSDAYQFAAAIGTTLDAIMAAGSAGSDDTAATAEVVAESARAFAQREQTRLQKGRGTPVKGRKDR